MCKEADEVSCILYAVKNTLTNLQRTAYPYGQYNWHKVQRISRNNYYKTEVCYI
jgi:hypothetical protein